MAVFVFIFFLLLLAYLAIMDSYTRWWNRAPETSGTSSSSVMVSVIVPARNEEENIRNLLSAFEAQAYPKDLVEFIVVDDHSSDNTLEQIKTHPFFPRLKLISLAEPQFGKKAAITAGVRQAVGELIITTDADCTMSDNWIATIAGFYQKTGAKFIAAPVQMTSHKNLSGIFQRLDFMMMQGITGAAVHSRMHCMCNGANLAYERKAFIEVNGFDGIEDLPTGDDMLLMYKIFKRDPNSIAYLKSRDAIVRTPAEAGWGSFLQQRIRWASKAGYYDDKNIMLIMIVTYVMNLCFVAMTVLSFIYPSYAWLLLLFVVMKIVTELPLIYSVTNFFGERRLVYLFPLLQPLHIIYVIVAGLLGQVGSYRWKSRTIKNKRHSKLVKQ